MNVTNLINFIEFNGTNSPSGSRWARRDTHKINHSLVRPFFLGFSRYNGKYTNGLHSR